MEQELPENTLGGSRSTAHEVKEISKKDRFLSILIGNNVKKMKAMTPSLEPEDKLKIEKSILYIPF